MPVVVYFRIAAALGFGGLLAVVLPNSSGASVPSTWLHITIASRTVHNSHYLAASFLYQLQTLLGTDESSPKVMAGKVVRRQGKELYIDLEQVAAEKALIVRQIAAQSPPSDEISLDEMGAYMEKHYYEITRPYPSVQALLHEHRYLNNPD